MGKDFLMELGCEEIPAKMLPDAIVDLKTLMEQNLRSSHLPFQKLKIFATPRRLAIYITSLSEKQPDSRVEIIGPPRQVAFSQDGAPGKAAIGFSRGQHIPLKEVKFIQKNGREFLMAEKVVKGKKADELLPDLLHKVLSELRFAKMMRWKNGIARFVRPVRSLLVLLGHQKIPMELFGVQSSSYTFGPRFLETGKIKISEPKEYLSTLKKYFVLVDQEERRAKIKKLLSEKAQKVGCHLVSDEDLEEEVTFLVEYPTAAVGIFSKRFLKLPEEILITTLKHHQKCFSLRKGKKLTNKFLSVINNRKEHIHRIMAGNKLIIEGRLNDAEFYWNRDRRMPLQKRVSLLKGLQFHEKLGNYYQKVQRIISLSSLLSEELHLDQELVQKVKEAAFLSKADLTTEMVQDFPELQGIIGGIYSREEGMDEDISQGIYEHYFPYNLAGKSPESMIGSILAISDRLDTIVGCFGLGFIPSGSRDPFALRRAAQGIIKVLVDKSLHLSLGRMTEQAMRLYAESSIPLTESEMMNKLREYFKDRMKFFFTFREYPYDCINAVMEGHSDDPFDAYLRLDALTKIREDKDFESLAISHKRIRNIITHQERGIIEPHLLREHDERELFQAYARAKDQIENFLRDRQYFYALKKMAALRTRVDRFFDHVLVMTGEAGLKKNRISLLASLSDLFMKVADFSKIVTPGSQLKEVKKE